MSMPDVWMSPEIRDGVFADMAFRYFDPNIAKAITQTGQSVIQMIINQYHVDIYTKGVVES